jgi:hypothetical protein
MEGYVVVVGCGDESWDAGFDVEHYESLDAVVAEYELDEAQVAELVAERYLSAEDGYWIMYPEADFDGDRFF